MRTKKSQSRLLPKLLTDKTWLQFVILLVLCILGPLPITTSRADELEIATLKTLYTYKFGKFTQWPDNKLNSASRQFQYCVLGQAPFSQNTLNMISGKLVQGIPLSVELFDSGLVPEEVLSACHIVFISSSERYRLATILASLKKKPVLTVSDIHGFSKKGGMITLVNDQGKLRFQINQQVLQQAELSISSKIMELAEIINEGGALMR
ncbi:MAG: YfiR family protein [Methyloprofundus sp.]|nr:YfiR family protein [Methyloprofundus sp.]